VIVPNFILPQPMKMRNVSGLDHEINAGGEVSGSFKVEHQFARGNNFIAAVIFFVVSTFGVGVHF